MYVLWKVSVEWTWVFGLWVFLKMCWGNDILGPCFHLIAQYPSKCSKEGLVRWRPPAKSSSHVWLLHLVPFMSPVLNMFLVLTGVSHQCHILWQHLSHHLQKIQQILWPPGNHPSLTSCPGYTAQVGVSIEILFLFFSNAFWTCEPVRLFVQINPQSLMTFPCRCVCVPPFDTFMNQRVG